MAAFSNFQLRVEVLVRWRHGSPAVLASPPHPHTQLQYQRLPKKYAASGATTNASTSVVTAKMSGTAPSTLGWSL